MPNVDTFRIYLEKYVCVEILKYQSTCIGAWFLCAQEKTNQMVSNVEVSKKIGKFIYVKTYFVKRRFSG